MASNARQEPENNFSHKSISSRSLARPAAVPFGEKQPIHWNAESRKL
jgi:hypothetical protein